MESVGLFVASFVEMKDHGGMVKRRPPQLLLGLLITIDSLSRKTASIG